MSGVPYIFGNATTSIPLSQLDVNFATNATIGTTSVGLGNTTTTLVGLTNVSTAVVNTSNVSANTSLLLQTNGTTTAVTIDTNQNVGIGTSSPSALLDVWGSGKSILVGGTASSNIPAQLSTALYLSGAYDVSNKRSYRMYVDGNGALNFDTTGSYAYANLPSSGTYANKMTLDTSGNLLIGYTSSNGSYKLQVNSQIFATSSTIATSDARYKENVEELSGALDIVKALRPVSFDWKAHPIHNFDTTTKTVGFLAQDVQQTLAEKPYLNSIIKTNECVIEPEVKDENGNVTKEAVTEEFLGIAEGNMISILTAAIQELSAQVTTLQSQVTALQAKVGV